MKDLVLFVLFSVVSVTTQAGFVPPIQERGFTPISNRWQTSLEDSADLEQFEPEHQHYEHEFGDHQTIEHIHQDIGHYQHEHFEDSEEHYPTVDAPHHPIIDAPHHPIIDHSHHELDELHEPREEKSVHLHEHHHHYHAHYKTLPISIIKKTVYYKHG